MYSKRSYTEDISVRSRVFFPSLEDLTINQPSIIATSNDPFQPDLEVTLNLDHPTFVSESTIIFQTENPVKQEEVEA